MVTERLKIGESIFYDFYPEDNGTIASGMTGRYELINKFRLTKTGTFIQNYSSDGTLSS